MYHIRSAFLTKYDKGDYKVRELFYFTKCGGQLLQNVTDHGFRNSVEIRVPDFLLKRISGF